MRVEELKEGFLQIISTTDQEHARRHYEDDPDSHISGILMVASEFLHTDPKHEVAFCEIMKALLSKDYIDSTHIEIYLNRLRERSDSRIGLLDRVWADIKESREN